MTPIYYERGDNFLYENEEIVKYTKTRLHNTLVNMRCTLEYPKKRGVKIWLR
jgi:hypothetical protein